jgi:hypothetical protein
VAATNRKGIEAVNEKDRTGRIGSRPLWVYWLANPVRAAHLVGGAVFLAGYLLVDSGPPGVYMVVAVVSGGMLLMVEWLRHPQIFRELAGAITLVKLLLLGAAQHGFLPGPATVLLAFVIASLGAHAPKLVRHRLLF